MSKYPHIKVKLSGQDGNAFFILGRVSKAMKSANIPAEEQKAFMDEAMSGDYDHLLRTCCEWVNVS
jgi:hypothetical protein